MCSACLAAGEPVTNVVDYELSGEDGAAYRRGKSVAAAPVRQMASEPRVPSSDAVSPVSEASEAGSTASAALSQTNSAWLFTYSSGTLCRSGVNHNMLANAFFIGEFRTLTPYPLVVSNSFFAPCVLDIPGTGTVLQGEVYSVSEETLAAIDKLQNVGSIYTRRAVRVSLVDDASFTGSAFLYMRHGPADDLLTPTLPVDSQLRKYVPRRACKSSMAPSEGDPGVQPSSRGEYNLSAVPSVACRGGSYPVPVNGSEPDSRHTSKAGENLRSILDLAPPKERAAETCTLQTPPALADAVGSSMYAGSAHRSKRMIYHSYQ